MYTWLMLICFIALMLTTAIQDFKNRAISAFLPVLIFVVSFLYAYFLFGFPDVAISTGMNIILLSFQFLLLYLYVRIFKKTENLTNSYLGWGDILFLLALSPLFAPFNFILFNLAAFVSVAIGYYLYPILNPNADKHIPLAGLVAILAGAAMLYLKTTHLYNTMYDNYWLINALNI